MTAANELVTEINNVLPATITPGVSSASTVSDLFETFIFCLVIEAAKTEGATVTYRDVFGKIPTAFVFRTSPGFIFSTVKPYTHAILNFVNKPPLEVHIGVRVVGKSGVLHECDLAVIEQVEAVTCRQEQVPPRSSKVKIAVECKFYSTPLQLHLARAFIGLVSDLSANEAIFVTNTASDSIEKLLSGRSRKWEHNLIPRANKEIGRLRNEFQTVFKNYKAR